MWFSGQANFQQDGFERWGTQISNAKGCECDYLWKGYDAIIKLG